MHTVNFLINLVDLCLGLCDAIGWLSKRLLQIGTNHMEELDKIFDHLLKGRLAESEKRVCRLSELQTTLDQTGLDWKID